MKGLYLSIQVVVFLLLGLTLGCNSKATKPVAKTASDAQPSSKEMEEMYKGLRDLAMGFTTADLGIEMPKEDNRAFGIVMDWNLGDGIATLTAFESGDASLYLSSGGGIIGGGQYENVRKVVADYLAIGQDFLSKASEAKTTPLAEKNMVKFYFLTNGGKYVGTESMANIENESSAWVKLFEEANKVITALRTTTKEE